MIVHCDKAPMVSLPANGFEYKESKVRLRRERRDHGSNCETILIFKPHYDETRTIIRLLPEKYSCLDYVGDAPCIKSIESRRQWTRPANIRAH
jgi:hypothetical protein